METQIPHSPNQGVNIVRECEPETYDIHREIEQMRNTDFTCESKKLFYQYYDSLTPEQRSKFPFL